MVRALTAAPKRPAFEPPNMAVTSGKLNAPLSRRNQLATTVSITGTQVDETTSECKARTRTRTPR